MSSKMGIWRWALASAVLVMAGTASARVIDPIGVTTNESTAIVLYPKLTVDISQGIDTVIQLTNTSEFLTKVHCFYTNANGHCSNNELQVCTPENASSVCALGGVCLPGWQETDFRLTLTKRQPISWSINDGLSSLPLADLPGQGNPPQFNEGNIPKVPEVPFTGELLCIQVDVTTEEPTDRNDLKGEAVTVKTDGPDIDVAKYNAIGIKAIEGRQDANPGVLNIGGPEAEYGVINEAVDPGFTGCPNVLTLNHFFEGANVITHDGTVQGEVNSVLTVVPCERDYLFQTANEPGLTIQFLIYNEFEQRFSASTHLDCYKQTRLAEIDTRPGPDGDAFSIFSVGTQGTLTGMSRLRSVAGPNVDGYDARGILAVLTENWASGSCSGSPLVLCSSDADCNEVGPCIGATTSTADANVQFQGSRPQGDRILIPLP